MTRVVAGSAGGRRLVVPRGQHIRPTSDRAREGLFSTLESLRGPLDGARFLDLYAGTGAVGIEALSRGGSHVLFVESDDVAVGVVRANLGALGLSGGEVRHMRVERLALTDPEPPPYDICFADPPYATEAATLAATLATIAGGWLAPNAVVVVERASRDLEWQWPEGLSGDRSRRYGDAMLWYGHKS
jgi:16S rRNA (guanine966-N2)-methyltransferase